MVSFLVSYVKRKGRATFGKGKILKAVFDLKGDIETILDGYIQILYKKDGKFYDDFGIH